MFLNRIDDIVIFSPLRLDEVKTIATMYLGRINHQLKEHGKELKFSESAVEYLAFKGFNIKYGARFLKRTIDELVKIPLTLRWKEKDKFAIDTEQGKLVIQ